MTTQTNSGKDKDIIYIDIDDEITAIIDKVRDSEGKIAALVLPKRATAMQSIVNMRLLKRAAESSKKHVVLITAEAGLLPLAGAVGLHVAKTPQSRPEVPPSPHGAPHDDDDEEAVSMVNEPKLDRARPIGEFTGAAAAGHGLDAEDEAIELDNTTGAERPLGAATGVKANAGKKDRKLMIPDFNKFRVLIIASAAALILIIVFGYLAVAVLPKASVSVRTDSEAIDTSIDVALDPEASTVDLEDDVVPAFRQETVKTASQTVDATGSVNKGEKAAGQVTVTNCSADDVTISAGSGFSANGLTFISKSSVIVPAALVRPSNQQCVPSTGQRTIDVVAQKTGAGYNLASGTTYAIANAPSRVTGEGGQMSGGTDVIVKIVSQTDIDTAKAKMVTQQADAIKLELANVITDRKYMALEDTFKPEANAEVTTDVAVGTEAEKVTVTSKTTYTMLGAKEDDLKKLIEREVNKEIDTKRQQILEYGLDTAFFKVQTADADNTVVTMSTTSVAGSDLQLDEIKRQIAGLKASDAKELIGKYPGVTEVDVTYSPFWVRSIPKKADKITVTIQEPRINNADKQ